MAHGSGSLDVQAPARPESPTPTRLVDSRMPAPRASLDQPYLNAHARVEHARRHRRAFFYHGNPPAY